MVIKYLKYLKFLVKYPLYRIFKNRNKYISNRNFLIIASILVAIVSAFAGILLKAGIHYIESLLINQQFLELRFQYFFYPIIGILLSLILVKYVLRIKQFDKGLSSVIYKINHNQGKIEGEHSYAHLLSSAVTVSLGGSVGVEAPIAITGSAIGSNLAKRLFVSPAEKTLLLACGAAAGISAIFNSPIAAVIFAFEVILTSVSVSGFIPLLIASATASVINHIFYEGQLIVFKTSGWEINAIPYYAILGVACGLISAYTIKVVYGIETKFGNHHQKINKAIFQGAIVGGLILISPLLYGEGYFVINRILDGGFDEFMKNLPLQNYLSYNTIFVIFILTTLLLKPIAAGFTVGAGGNGGIFAPSLFIGALTGLLVGRIINIFTVEPINELNFVVAGMAGLISGVVSAPLTGIFMIAEVSGGYLLFVPLMISSALSYFTTRFFEPNSIYSKRLADMGKLNKNKDELLLESFSIRAILETDFITLLPDQTLRQLSEIVKKSKHNIYPVLNRNGSIAGSLTFDQLKPVLFKPELYDKIKVKDLMQGANIIMDIEDNLYTVQITFEKNDNNWFLPVQQNDKFIGLISHSGLLNKYKDIMQEAINEE